MESSPLQPPWALPTAAEPATVAATTLVLLSLFFFRPPSARWARRLAPASRDQDTRAPAAPPPSSGPRAARPAGHPLVEPLLAAVALSLVAWSLATLDSALGVPSLWLGALGARVTVALLDPPPDGTGRSRLRVLGAPGLAPAAAIAVVALWTGTLRLEGIVQAQGPAPWTWIAFRNPLAFMLLPAFAAGAVASWGATGTTATEGAVGATWVTRAAAAVHVLLAAALGVVLFLGGWQSAPGTAPWVGWLIFGLKGGALLALGAWLARMGSRMPRRAQHAIPAVLAVGSVLGSGLWFLDGLAPRVAAVSGPTLFLTTLLAASFELTLRLRRRRAPELHLDPLL